MQHQHETFENQIHFMLFSVYNDSIKLIAEHEFRTDGGHSWNSHILYPLVFYQLVFCPNHKKFQITI